MATPAAKPHSRVLEVSLGDVPVGALTLFPTQQTLFTFYEEYVEDKLRPTLSLSFKQASGGLRTAVRPTATRLPPFFSNLLPEGHLRNYLAEKAGVHPDREFFLLSALGDDLPGAIRISTLEVAPVLDAIPPPLTADSSPHDAYRFSLAGVQLKFSALMEASGGLTIPVHGVNGQWIVKLPSSRFKSVPENEYTMMKFAQMVGIEIPEVRLIRTNSVKNLPSDLPENFGNSLVVRRFDRDESGRRIHIEDLAQVYGLFPEQKYRKVSYTNIANLLWTETGEPGVIEFIKRLVFSMGIGNADMHVKNWSLIYRDTRTPELAPAYDFVSTIAYLNGNKPALGMPGVAVETMLDVDTDSFRRIAAKAQIPELLVMKTVEETVAKMKDYWQEAKDKHPLPPGIADKVQAHMNAVPVMSLK